METQQIYLKALSINEVAARHAFLDQVCRSDADLRKKIDDLLEQHFRGKSASDASTAGLLVPEETSVLTDDYDVRKVTTSHLAKKEELQSFLKKSSRPGCLGRLAHYEIESILGAGAFGSVFKAFDEKLHRLVAIKVMNSELGVVASAKSRFLREARTAAAVVHPNIVSIFAVEEEPVPYIVMEYVSGSTLQNRLDTCGPLTLSEILRVSTQLAEGLAAAHSANLIHRDIKPLNILLTDASSCQVKITDFGLARLVDDASLTQDGLILGTPKYMAPEQINGEPLDHRTDLFSLGAVIYYMIVGAPPFNAESTIAVLKQVLDVQPQPILERRPDTPKWLCNLVEKLMEKNPVDRFQSAREVVELLGDYSLERSFDEKSKSSLLEVPLRHTQGRVTKSKHLYAASISIIVLILVWVMWQQYAPSQFHVHSTNSSNPSTPNSTHLAFDGVDDFVDLTGKWEYEGGDFTFEAWIVPAEVQGTGADNFLVIDQGGTDRRKSLRLLRSRFINDKGQLVHNFHLSRPPDTTVNTFTVNLEPGKPTHLAAVWANNGSRLYVNGKPVKSTHYTYNFKARETPAYVWLGAIGELDTASGRMRAAGCWRGELLQVRLSQAAEYVTEFLPNKVLEKTRSTIALYRCNENEGIILHDSSGNANDGRIIGATWIPSKSTP